jgi:hypothetical protein
MRVHPDVSEDERASGKSQSSTVCGTSPRSFDHDRTIALATLDESVMVGPDTICLARRLTAASRADHKRTAVPVPRKSQAAGLIVK